MQRSQRQQKITAEQLLQIERLLEEKKAKQVDTKNLSSIITISFGYLISVNYIAAKSFALDENNPALGVESLNNDKMNDKQLQYLQEKTLMHYVAIGLLMLYAAAVVHKRAIENSLDEYKELTYDKAAAEIESLKNEIIFLNDKDYALNKVYAVLPVTSLLTLIGLSSFGILTIPALVGLAIYTIINREIGSQRYTLSSHLRSARQNQTAALVNTLQNILAEILSCQIRAINDNYLQKIQIELPNTRQMQKLYKQIINIFRKNGISISYQLENLIYLSGAQTLSAGQTEALKSEIETLVSDTSFLRTLRDQLYQVLRAIGSTHYAYTKPVANGKGYEVSIPINKNSQEIASLIQDIFKVKSVEIKPNELTFVVSSLNDKFEEKLAALVLPSEPSMQAEQIFEVTPASNNNNLKAAYPRAEKNASARFFSDVNVDKDEKSEAKKISWCDDTFTYDPSSKSNNVRPITTNNRLSTPRFACSSLKESDFQDCPQLWKKYKEVMKNPSDAKSRRGATGIVYLTEEVKDAKGNIVKADAKYKFLGNFGNVRVFMHKHVAENGAELYEAFKVSTKHN